MKRSRKLSLLKLSLLERRRRALEDVIPHSPTTLTEADLAWIEQRLGLDQRIEAAIARRLGARPASAGGCE